MQHFFLWKNNTQARWNNESFDIIPLSLNQKRHCLSFLCY